LLQRTLGIMSDSRPPAGIFLITSAAPRGFTVEDLVNDGTRRQPGGVAGRQPRRLHRAQHRHGKNKGHTEPVDLPTCAPPTPQPQRLTSDAASSTDPEWSAGGRRHLFPVEPLGLVAGLAPAAGRRRAGSR
jgi:hypothetical protein